MSVQLSLFIDSISTETKFPSTRYQGSKQKFVDWIWNCIKDIPFQTALDAFGGTGCVAFRLKQAGKSVIYNDILPFNQIIGKALIENNDTILAEHEVESLLKEWKDVVYPSFIANTFKDVYYTDAENRWLDVVSTNIRQMSDDKKQAIAYFALFQACIIKRPYNLFHRKNLYVRLQDVKRSFGNKKTWDTSFATHFRKFVNEANMAVFDNGESCHSMNKDAFEIDADYDFVYIDTPYLSKKNISVDYADFYHFLDGLMDYENWKDNIDYSSKHLRLKRHKDVWSNAATIYSAFERLFTHFQKSKMAISYRSDGIPSIEELVQMLKKMNKDVRVYQSMEIKYALSKQQSSEVLIVAL